MKKKKNRDRGKKISFIDEILDMPKEISSGTPKITLVGFGEMLIENYKGILEYEELYIKINTYSLFLFHFTMNINNIVRVKHIISNNNPFVFCLGHIRNIMEIKWQMHFFSIGEYNRSFIFIFFLENRQLCTPNKTVLSSAQFLTVSVC